MSKAHRGKGIRETVNRSRGICPLCKRTGIKVVYEKDLNEKKVKICKQCNVAVGAGKLQEAIAALS